ncbi:MAG: glycosyltransferase family 4 protein [Miniphocaeibacter sp.]|uniref:glycosyltransferase family 4 protein n=1 Tax=Miniphocaeibacter sp. TaxID=3100973 RepID=UPI0017D9A5CB|nr:glycosyltransferase family 4 protein [Gallicola sp.]
MRNSVLEVCSYYMGSTLYQSLFDQFDYKKIDYDILYFCSRKTVIEREIPDNLIVSQSFHPWDRAVFHIKHNKVYKDIQNKIDFNKYYMTHAHSLVSNGYISMKIKEDYGIPYIVAVRNTDLFTFLRLYPFVRNTARKILNEAEKVIFLSPTYRDLTVNKYVKVEDREKILEKSIILPNGIDQYYLDNGQIREKNSINDVNLIYVGRVDDLNKNVITTIKACKKLIKEGYNVNLTLVGRLKNSIFKRIVENNKFISHISETDKYGVREALNKNDIFVMPSKKETFGLVYVEAMSQGLPVVYTKGQGFDGQFPEGHVGYHVWYKDADGIVDRIKDILKDYNNMSINASKSAKKFNWKDISKEYIEIYNNIKE